MNIRIPQILEIHKLKSVHGISLSLFVITIFANVSYGISILLRFPTINYEFWANTAPFLIGSMGVLVFDILLIIQATYYTR